MKIEETRTNNIYNLQAVERYFGLRENTLQTHYQELIEDRKFLDGLNDQIVDCSSKQGFKKGIFAAGPVNSIDWFAFQRILLYVLVRHLKPKYALETGVYYGGNTAFILNALHKNGLGTLVSIDLPDSKIRALREKGETSLGLSRHPDVGASEYYEGLTPGFIIPRYLKAAWNFIEGSSLEEIPKLGQVFDFYIHDSDHSFGFLNQELALAMQKMAKTATIVVDDINWSNAFYKFCAEQELYPLLLTDNGKGNLDVRTGVAYLQHPNNRSLAITGNRLEQGSDL